MGNVEYCRFQCEQYKSHYQAPVVLNLVVREEHQKVADNANDGKSICQRHAESCLQMDFRNSIHQYCGGQQADAGGDDIKGVVAGQ